MAYKLWDRYSPESLARGVQDAKGRLFLSSLGQRNLKHVEFLHEGVDTIRQLYTGILKPHVLEHIKQTYELGPSNKLIHVLGRDWLIGSGGSSGYRYRLQDGDDGVILFVCSRYAVESSDNSHLKIELSPHYIDAKSSKTIQSEIDLLAARLLDNSKPSGCAIHICVDLQGWQPQKDFADQLITRSTRRVDHRGISDFSVDIAGVSAVYGNSQSFLFGSAGGLQFSLYRKDLQAKAADKIHFWESTWARRTWDDFKPIYDPAKPVWRFEFRFHQTVIKEFSESVQQQLLSFFDLVPHLTGLFRYALGNFRLNAVSSSASKNASFYRGVYIDPMWQLLMQNIEILGPHTNFFYKRKRRKPGQFGLRNLGNAVGNLTSLYAAKGFGVRQSLKCLKNSGIWEDHLAYYRSKYDDFRCVSDEVIERFFAGELDIKLRERVLRGVAV